MVVEAKEISNLASVKVSGKANYGNNELKDSLTQFSTIMPKGFPKEES